MDYIPYAAILAALALIHLPRVVVANEMKQQQGGYDNRDPRGAQTRLEGRGRRALGAHNNGFEAFAPFAAAVLAAMQRNPHHAAIAWLCIGFVAARSAYVAAYLADIPTARSALWTLGFAATVALMILAIIGP